MRGSCYTSGIGVESNFLEAVKWFRRAAEQGIGEIQQLDICFDNFMESDEELVKCYQKASVQNDVKSVKCSNAGMTLTACVITRK